MQIYLQPKANLQRRKDLMAKSTTAIRIIVVEMHYSGALGFLDCSLKIPANLLYFAWGKLGALKSAPNQPEKQ